MNITTYRRKPLQRIQRIVHGTILYCGLFVGLLVFCIPLYYMVTTSIKSESDALVIPIRWLPSHLYLENYAGAFKVAPFARYFFNSVVVALTTVASTLFLCTIAGYGLAKYHFRGRELIFLFILSTMMIPFQVIVIPVYGMVYHLGWTNSYAGLVIPGSMSAFGVFMMRQFSLTLPDELLDAARIDGASEIGIFWRIAVPMLYPGLATLALLTFVSSWNDFQWPLLVVTKQDLFTLPIGMAVFSQPLREPYWTYIMVISTIATLPVVLIFIASQLYLTEGIILSGLKA